MVHNIDHTGLIGLIRPHHVRWAIEFGDGELLISERTLYIEL